MHGGRPNSGEADSAGGDILLRSPAPARKAYPEDSPEDDASYDEDTAHRRRAHKYVWPAGPA